MGFEKLKDSIRESYRTPDNIVDDFYIPLLSNAKRYDRAVGFFSSSVLIELSRGLINLINNGGKMRLITSPKLQEDDIQAIKDGYDKRTKIEEVIMREWKEPKNWVEEERLNFLSHMVEEGHLDIKIAFKKPIGLYHEKIGILADENGNIVAFSGSLNESEQAISLNFESIDAFTSWKDLSRTDTKIKYFEETWANDTQMLEVIDFPKVAREKLQSYKKEHYNENIDEEEKEYIKNHQKDEIIYDNEIKEFPLNVPRVPPISDSFNGFYDYQEEAIENWANAGYRGIFDMATGTGKTLTALGAITRLYKDIGGKLAVVICCPYIHLVTQWCEDLERFNILPIIGFSNSPQKKWKEDLAKQVSRFNSKYIDNAFFCFITTNATFSRSHDVQEQLKKLKQNALFVADEAHNLGAEKALKKLPNFQYRLGLSATINRHLDEAGTKGLFNYFGDKCIEYPLERAIKEGKLTPYDYKPHIIILDNGELEEYKNISLELSKYHTPEGEEPCDAAKMLLIQRARILANAKNKIPELKRILIETGDYKEHNLLIYCGDSNVSEVEYASKNEQDELVKSTEFGVKQLDAVRRILGSPNELDMMVRQFTSQESPKEREEIKKYFVKKKIQAIIAIKCLDEGVNIPCIKTAYILASTTNPKEYIQRRGRVLRKFEGKDKSIIHDFIVMPCYPSDFHNFTPDQFYVNAGIINRELKRMKLFASIAENGVEANSIISDYERILEELDKKKIKYEKEE